MESLIRMREDVLNERDDQGVEDLLDGSRPMFDRTPEIGGYSSSIPLTIMRIMSTQVDASEENGSNIRQREGKGD